nr:hypothetical protein [Salinicola acroporae]
MSLELLPPHQRLVMLEASALRPQLGERLMSGLSGDRAEYRFVALRDSALNDAESLAEHDPRVDLLTVDAAIPAIGANVALVTLDGTQDEIDALLQWLPGQLADDAQIALLALGDTDWQSFLSLAVATDSRPADLETTRQRLETLGYRQLERHALENDQGGLQLLTAQAPLPSAAAAASGSDRDDSTHDDQQWLVISDDGAQWLASRLVSRFETLGQAVHHLAGSELPPGNCCRWRWSPSHRPRSSTCAAWPARPRIAACWPPNGFRCWSRRNAMPRCGGSRSAWARISLHCPGPLPTRLRGLTLPGSPSCPKTRRNDPSCPKRQRNDPSCPKTQRFGASAGRCRTRPVAARSGCSTCRCRAATRCRANCWMRCCWN